MITYVAAIESYFHPETLLQYTLLHEVHTLHKQNLGMLWRVFQTKVKQLNTFNCLKDLKIFMLSWRQREKKICNSDLTNIHVSTKGILLLKFNLIKLYKQQNFPRFYQKAVLSHYFIVITIS